MFLINNRLFDYIFRFCYICFILRLKNVEKVAVF